MQTALHTDGVRAMVTRLLPVWPESRQWYQWLSLQCTHNKKLPPLLKGIFDETVKINLLNLDPWIRIFVILSLRKWEVDLQYFCYILRNDGCLEKRHLCDWFVSSPSHLFMEYYFYLKEQLADKLVIWTGIYQTFSQKWQKWACHFKKKNSQYLLLVLKVELSSETDFWKTCILHCEADTF